MQQPQGETRWQSMTDNPMTDKGVAQSMGERLAATRRRLGLSQRRVAELSGLTHGAICMIEQDKVSPSVASLQKLLSVYELPLSRFFAEEEGGTPSVVIKAEQLIELGSQGVSMKLVHNGNNRRQLGFMLETYAPVPTPAARSRIWGGGGHRAGGIGDPDGGGPGLSAQRRGQLRDRHGRAPQFQQSVGAGVPHRQRPHPGQLLVPRHRLVWEKNR